MARGSKAKYGSKRRRRAGHIAEGYEKRDTSAKTARARGWATVNKESGGRDAQRRGGGQEGHTGTVSARGARVTGGKKSGSGRSKTASRRSSRKGVRTGSTRGARAGTRTARARSTAARKSARTRGRKKAA